MMAEHITQTMPPRSCERCLYWQALNRPATGACRRHAPHSRALNRIGDYNWAEWPLTTAGDWCGEFLQAGPPAVPDDMRS